MKSKKTLHQKTSIATIALLVLASMAALPGFAPTASAEEDTCIDSGNPEAFIYVRACVSFAGEISEEVPTDVALEPEVEPFCVIGDLCPPTPKDITNWVELEFQPVTVSTADVSEHDVRVNSEQLGELVCSVHPPTCREIMNLVEAALTDFVVQVASTDGESITGVVVTGGDGTNLYIGV